MDLTGCSITYIGTLTLLTLCLIIVLVKLFTLLHTLNTHLYL